MELLKSLNWRYATKQFDKNRRIPEDKLRLIMEAVRLAPSSYGLQLYKVLLIENDEIREKLKAASWNQGQITDSSALVVFCNYTNVADNHIDEYLRLKSKTENCDITDLKGYGDFMKAKVSEMSKRDMNFWTARQTYIALGFLLTACAELKIDACPMEGFEADKYNAILGLTDKNLNAAVIATIGYRTESDSTQHQPKVRKAVEDMFEIVRNESLRKAV